MRAVCSRPVRRKNHALYQISAHGTTCRLCAGLEGRVYSKSGTDPDFPPLAAAFGKMDKNGPDDLSNSRSTTCFDTPVIPTPVDVRVPIIAENRSVFIANR